MYFYWIWSNVPRRKNTRRQCRASSLRCCCPPSTFNIKSAYRIIRLWIRFSLAFSDTTIEFELIQTHAHTQISPNEMYTFWVVFVCVSECTCVCARWPKRIDVWHLCHWSAVRVSGSYGRVDFYRKSLCATVRLFGRNEGRVRCVCVCVCVHSVTFCHHFDANLMVYLHENFNEKNKIGQHELEHEHTCYVRVIDNVKVLGRPFRLDVYVLACVWVLAGVPMCERERAQQCWRYSTVCAVGLSKMPSGLINDDT